MTSSACQHLFKNTFSLYKHAMRKWTKGTGGGPGYPENYCDWEERSDDIFARYIVVLLNTLDTYY